MNNLMRAGQTGPGSSCCWSDLFFSFFKCELWRRTSTGGAEGEEPGSSHAGVTEGNLQEDHVVRPSDHRRRRLVFVVKRLPDV